MRQAVCESGARDAEAVATAHKYALARPKEEEEEETPVCSRRPFRFFESLLLEGLESFCARRFPKDAKASRRFPSERDKREREITRRNFSVSE